MVKKIARGLIVTIFGILLFKVLAVMQEVQGFVSAFPLLIFIAMALFLLYKEKFFEVFNIKDVVVRSLFVIGAGIFMFQSLSNIPIIEKMIMGAPVVVLIVIVLVFVFIDKICGKMGVKVVD